VCLVCGYPWYVIMFRALEVGALCEGYAQKGFVVSGIALDGSPFPLGSTTLLRSLPGHIAQKVEWGEALDGHRVLNPVDQEAQQSRNKRIPATINDYRGMGGWS
jgi:hypothetical protein